MNSFDMVFEENYTKLYTLAFRLTGKKEDAEDVIQNSFLNAFKAYDNFRQESSVYTWLYRIVIREAKKYVKLMHKMPVDEYADSQNISSDEVYRHINSFGCSEDDVLVQATKETCLQLFMNCMPPKYRIVFTLRMILDLSVKETAEILDIKETTVKVNLHRARNIIKSYMSGKCSLINPNNLCRCDSWAMYTIKSNKSLLQNDIKVIKKQKNELSKEFKNEVNELYKIVQLYDNLIVPQSFDEFKKHIQKLIDEKQLKILEKE